MFGNNKPVKQQKLEDYDGTIGITEIFHTIQGEGPFTGQPAVFIRVKDCSLCCHFCDTEFSIGNQLSTIEILIKITKLTQENKTELIVITGGEPFIHQGIRYLIETLLNLDYHVQVETCGVNTLLNLPYENPEFDIVVSPKTSKINKDIDKHALAFKYIVAAGEVDKDGFPNKSTQVKGRPLKIARPTRSSVPIYVSPCDEHDDKCNKSNTETAIKICMKHNRILNLQIHKIVGLA